MATAFLCEECPRTLECIVCGKKFLFAKTKRGPFPRFCTAACKSERQKAQKRQYQQEGRIYRKPGYRPPPKRKTCVVCREQFDTYNGSKTIACSRRCGKSLSDASRLAGAMARKQRVCQQCATPFTEGRLSGKQLAAGYRQRFCSRLCAAAGARLYETKADATRAEVDRARARKGLPPTGTPIPKVCVSCGDGFATLRPSAIKCKGCSRSQPCPIPRQTRPCDGCGIPVTGTAAKRKCKQCSLKKSREARKAAHGRVNKHRHRARRFGVEYEPINPLKVFERDGWKCQVCGCKTPKRLRGTYEQTAPELDHRVPMAMGGPHTWANVQTCCRACNQRKGGTKVEGQLRLFA